MMFKTIFTFFLGLTLTASFAAAHTTKPPAAAKNAKSAEKGKTVSRSDSTDAKQQRAPSGKSVATQSSKEQATPAPQPSRGWIVVEESVLWPLYKEPQLVLQNSEEAFRAHDEKKAAAELRKASSWLHLMDSHATVEGRYQLVQARKRIDKIAADLENGNAVKAEKLSKNLASAYTAIANEHYLKAKEIVTGSTADKDSDKAAQHLIAAGLYMQSAARSAFQEFSDETQESLDAFNAIGNDFGTQAKIDPDSLADQLRVIGNGLQQLGADLQKP